MKISILGVPYEIIRRDYKDDPEFEKSNIDGYCENCLKKIVVGNLKTFPQFERADDESIKLAEKEVLRHEIIHAFLNESGLQCCACEVTGPWAKNEEMVDWFAIQGEKIYRVWRIAGAV